MNYENYKGYLNLLGEMGPMARSAVPAILKTMTNWGTDMSRPVRPVLAKIDPEAAAALNRKAIRSQTQFEVVRRPVYPISGDW